MKRNVALYLDISSQLAEALLTQSFICALVCVSRKYMTSHTPLDLSSYEYRFYCFKGEEGRKQKNNILVLKMTINRSGSQLFKPHFWMFLEFKNNQCWPPHLWTGNLTSNTFLTFLSQLLRDLSYSFFLGFSHEYEGYMLINLTVFFLLIFLSQELKG